MPAARKPPLLERLGVGYFRRRAPRARPQEAGDAVHTLTPDERAALRRIEHGAIARACAAGALSALASAIAETLAAPLLGADPAAATAAQTIQFWAWVGGVTIVATACEIAFLYWDALRSVHALADAAGLELFGAGEERAAVAAALARAALELPNPPDAVFGVDPRREASKARLVLATLLYKLKVGATSFLLKMILRRLLGRALVRAWLQFVAVPVTAAWNGLVAWKVLREARVRAMGPSAAREWVDAVLADGGAPSDAARDAAFRAVACAVVRTRDLHPNHLALLGHLRARLGDSAGADLDSPTTFLARLGALSPPEQDLALRVLAVAAIVDGRITAAERALVRDALAACGRAPDDAAVVRLRRAFLSGDAIAAADFAAAAEPSP